MPLTFFNSCNHSHTEQLSSHTWTNSYPSSSPHLLRFRIRRASVIFRQITFQIRTKYQVAMDMFRAEILTTGGQCAEHIILQYSIILSCQIQQVISYLVKLFQTNSRHHVIMSLRVISRVIAWFKISVLILYNGFQKQQVNTGHQYRQQQPQYHLKVNIVPDT